MLRDKILPSLLDDSTQERCVVLRVEPHHTHRRAMRIVNTSSYTRNKYRVALINVAYTHGKASVAYPVSDAVWCVPM